MTRYTRESLERALTHHLGKPLLTEYTEYESRAKADPLGVWFRDEDGCYNIHSSGVPGGGWIKFHSFKEVHAYCLGLKDGRQLMEIKQLDEAFNETYDRLAKEPKPTFTKSERREAKEWLARISETLEG